MCHSRSNSTLFLDQKNVTSQSDPRDLSDLGDLSLTPLNVDKCPIQVQVAQVV